MALRSQDPVKSQRPARIRVPNRERVLFTVHDHKFVGILQRLSLTGGSVIHTEKAQPHGTLAGLALKTVHGKVNAQIEFLHIGADGNTAAQAFRFLGMDDPAARRLSASIEQMQSAGYSDRKIEPPGLAKLVSYSLCTIRGHIQRLLQAGSRRRKVRTRS